MSTYCCCYPLLLNKNTSSQYVSVSIRPIITIYTKEILYFWMCLYCLSILIHTQCKVLGLISFTALERSIGQPTKYYQPTSIYTVSLVCLSLTVRVITCLIKSVFFIHHGWRKWTDSCHKMSFQSWSIYDRNTSVGAKGLWEWGSELIKCC
jgi:hypothetical protein